MKSTKRFPMALCCPPRRVPCHILNRETFSRSRWRRCRDPQPHIIQGKNLNWRPLFGPFLQRLRNPGEEWEETCRRQREWKTTGGNDHQINSYGPHWAHRASMLACTDLHKVLCVYVMTNRLMFCGTPNSGSR